MRAPAIEAQSLLRLMCLTLNHQSLIATKAKSSCALPRGALCRNSTSPGAGSRRRGVRARAAYLAGAAARPALADERYGVPAGGTICIPGCRCSKTNLRL